jgi:hypothetical protein
MASQTAKLSWQYLSLDTTIAGATRNVAGYGCCVGSSVLAALPISSSGTA